MPLEVSKGCEASSSDDAGPRAFSRVSTGDSDIPSSCTMKDEPAFKGNAGKSGLLSNQVITLSIPLEAVNSGSLSHTYC